MDDVERLASEVIRRLRGNETGTRESGEGETASRRSGGNETGTRESSAGGTAPGIPVAVSGRHMHVARGVLDRLFGEGFQLTKLRDLGQPGEFASEQTVTVVGRSLAPTRSAWASIRPSVRRGT